MRKLFKNGRYANVTATLALFVALGGTSYAALTLPANSVSTKQIKKGSVTLNRISSGARAALKGQTGKTGPQGPAGPAGPAGGSTGSSSVLWATILAPGGIVADRSSHALTSTPIQTGVYYVQFDRDVSKCAMQVTLGGDQGNALVPGEAAARSRDDLHTNEVTVNTYNSAGVASNRSFFLNVFC